MSTTVNIICYKSKTLKNGEHPLMLRICKDRKTKYQSLGISIKSEHWDFTRNRPKPICPNKDLINKIILDKELQFQKQILELKSDDKEFTASTLIAPKIRVKQKTVGEFYDELVKELDATNKIGNARVYETSYKSLKTYTNSELDIPFSHIDVEFLKGYEKWLRQKNCAETSMNLYLRTVRSVYNRAIDAKHAKKATYPFDEYKVSKFSIKTEKRAIPKDVVKQIMNLDVSKESEYVQFSKDLFVFSYLCSGINFADMANLKTTNIVENRLVYIRKKTKKKINIPLCEEAKSILNKYLESSSMRGYIFPIFDKAIHQTDMQRHYRRQKVLLKVNHGLKKIAEILGITANLTTYVARHSYATVLKNSGVNIALIGETLGHSDLKTTQIYLDSFENSQIDEALENLL